MYYRNLNILRNHLCDTYMITRSEDMSEKKRYIEKFIENKKVPNEIFSITKPDGVEVQIDLTTTVQRIYDEGQGSQVKTILKKGAFRNATIEKCLKLFEGAAQRFLLDDMNNEISNKVQDILEKAHRRKNSLFLEMEEGEEKLAYEIIFINRDEREEPYLLKNMNDNEITPFSKKAFIEFLLGKNEKIKNII